MTSNLMFSAIAAAAVLAGGSALAGQDRAPIDQTSQRAVQDDHRAERKHHDRDRQEARVSSALQVVPNASLPDQPSYGWQYFSDQQAKVAVVISPTGEYFLSRGDGPRQITGPAGNALATPPGRD